MLENLIKKYKEEDISEVVYKLSFAGKFIIVKGRTLAGSLIIISNTFSQYNSDKERFKGHLYKHLYDHYAANKESGSRFRVKILYKPGKNHDHYKMLKREQMELDKNRYNPLCLNNQTESYIPLFNDNTDSFGWINKTSVMNFKKWLNSAERKAYVEKYSKMPAPKPAMSDL